MSADSPSSKGEAVGIGEARERILDAAEDLFAADGFDAKPTARIARRAAVAKGLLFYYFPRKMDLLRTLFAERLPAHPLSSIAGIAVQGDMAGSLVRLADRIGLTGQHSQMLSAILFREASTHSDVRDHLHALYAALMELTESVLDAASPNQLDHDRRTEAAGTFVAVLLHEANSHRFDGPVPDLPATAKIVSGALLAQAQSSTTCPTGTPPVPWEPIRGSVTSQPAPKCAGGPPSLLTWSFETDAGDKRDRQPPLLGAARSEPVRTPPSSSLEWRPSGPGTPGWRLFGCSNLRCGAPPDPWLRHLIRALLPNLGGSCRSFRDHRIEFAMAQQSSSPHEVFPHELYADFDHQVLLFPTRLAADVPIDLPAHSASRPGTRPPARVRARAIRQVIVLEVSGRLGDVVEDLDLAIQLALADEPRGVVCGLSAVLEGVEPVAAEVLATAGRHVRDWPGIPVVVASPDPQLREALHAHPLGAHLIVTESVFCAVSAVLVTPTLTVERLRLAPHPTAPRASRDFVTRTLVGWQLNRLAPIASLVVSELVTRSSINAGTDIDLSVVWNLGALRLTVREHRPRLPGQPHSGLDVHRQGLTLVAGLSRAFGALPTDDDDKVVWAVLDAPGHRRQPATIVPRVSPGSLLYSAMPGQWRSSSQVGSSKGVTDDVNMPLARAGCRFVGLAVRWLLPARQPRGLLPSRRRARPFAPQPRPRSQGRVRGLPRPAELSQARPPGT